MLALDSAQSDGVIKTELWSQLDLGLRFPFKTYLFLVEDISMIEHLLSLAFMRVSRFTVLGVLERELVFPPIKWECS